MKFDFVIGNPPYQEDTKDTSDKPVYNLFMDAAYNISNKVELITPARFLFNAGKTPKLWNEKMLSDTHLKVLNFQQNSSSAFPNTDIMGGICITYRDTSKNYGAIGVYSAFHELNSIKKKVHAHQGFKTLDDEIIPQNCWDLEALYKDHPELKNKIGSAGREKRLTTSIFTTVKDIFSEEENGDDLKVLGLINNGSVTTNG